jgi:hypothetical protein
VDYYGRFHRSELYPLLRRINAYLRRWAGRKYKRLRTNKRYDRWLDGLLSRQPALFTHWRRVRTYQDRSEEPGDGRLSRRDLREPGAAMPPGHPTRFWRWRGGRVSATWEQAFRPTRNGR